MIEMRALAAIGILASSLAACARTDAPTITGPTALINANIVPMDTERVIRGGVIVIDGDRITAFGAAEDLPIPDGARIVDVAGGYVLPGLMDMHVHLGFPNLESREAHRHLSLFLRYGVTTVRNMHGTPAHLALRDSIRAGSVVGPTVYSTSPMFPGRLQESPEQAREAVRAFSDAGYDGIKVVRVPPEILGAIIDEASQVGLPAVGHLPNLEMPFQDIIASGMISLEHAMEIYWSAFDGEPETEAIPDVVELIHSAGVAVSTLLGPGVIMDAATRDGDSFLRSPLADSIVQAVGPEGLDGVRDAVDRASNGGGRPADRPFNLGFMLEFMRAFDAAGGVLVVGTDSRTAESVPGQALHRELALFRRAGLPPYRALRTVTRNPAHLLGLEMTKGVVAVGADADLIVVRENPLASLEHLAQPSGMVLRRRWLSSREVLDSLVVAHQRIRSTFNPGSEAIGPSSLDRSRRSDTSRNNSTPPTLDL